MGNRAVINKQGTDEALYIHWNGGRDTVEPVLVYGKMLGHKFTIDTLAAILEKMELRPKVGLKQHLDCDNWDNGVYVVEDWEIVGREYFDGEEQACYNPFHVILWTNDKCGTPIKPFELADKYIEMGYNIYMDVNLLGTYPEFKNYKKRE